jgi:malate dehydrogenase (oxaloacetate-decarboxylating)(NADP+)
MAAGRDVSREDVLDYHRSGRPGKLQIQGTKPLLSQRDFSLAYSPGVAFAVREVDADPLTAYEYTAKGNLVAVVTNGTAVLGLGNRGPVPAKPVMEGKALLFKQLADVDVYDIELDAPTASEVIAAVRAIAPGFGGINLEDIAAPACFEVENSLRGQLDIPVFHDDQHGTAIITGAALLNALQLTGKAIDEIRVVVNGAGAAGVACADMYVSLGVRREHITMFDRVGMIVEGRTEEMDPYKGAYARPGPPLSLGEALREADVLLGVSVADVLTQDMLLDMARDPILFLLANPDPEIRYELAIAARPDAIVATGRSDYPNQVNNVLVFPFMFRGALDVRARAINEPMKLAATHALAELAREAVPEPVLQAYSLQQLRFGRDYIIPKPNDERALERVAVAVAQAAMESGVSRVTVDLELYRERLQGLQNRGRRVVQTVMDKARHNPQRIVFPDGENARIVRAAELLEREGVARTTLLGRPDVVRSIAADLGIEFVPDVVDPATDPRSSSYATEIYALRQRRGVTQERAEEMARTPSIFGLMMVRSGEANAYLSGLAAEYPAVLRPIFEFIPLRQGTTTVSGVFLVLAGDSVRFFADGLVNINPTAEAMADIASLTADFVKNFDIEPRVALVSYSNFGSSRHEDAEKVRRAVQLARARRPDLQIDGEMQVDTALSARIVDERYPFSTVRSANVLIFPNLDASTAAFKALSELGGAYVLGPVLLGPSSSVHALQPSMDAEAIVLLSALAAVGAQERAQNAEYVESLPSSPRAAET